VSSKIAFFLQQYFLLGLFLISILGWGRLLTKLVRPAAAIPPLSIGVLQAAAGLGLVTIITFVVAAFGALTTIPVLVIVVTGIALYIPRLIAVVGRCNVRGDSLMIGNLGRAPSLLLLAMAGVFILNTLVRPLKLPMGWDEIAYHLPTAQAWAEAGKLVVTDWLRYPLFPFNMELLYAGTLILANDITTHLVHALTGFLAVALTFSLARMFMPLAFSAVAATFLVYAIRQSVETADIDSGLMLYIFCACASLGFCYLAKQSRLALLSAFFIGLALGTKYQAMFFLPAYAAGFLLVERNWKVLSLAVLIAVITASYWYVRNFLVSGDPVHPLGGSVLGYWLWNADDIRRQFLDLRGARQPPPIYLWPSIGSLIFWRSSAPVVKGGMVVAVIGALVWLIVSGYARYLIPMYPLLALLSSYFLYRVIDRVGAYQLAATYKGLLGEKAQSVTIVMVLLALIYAGGKATYKNLKEIVLPDSAERIAVLQRSYPGFELLGGLRKSLPGTVYQLGFEDEIYYLGTPVLGDHFGRARYTDVERYVGKSAALSKHLHSLGASYLLVNLVRHPAFVTDATADPDFPDYFDLLGETSRAVLYRLK
jgi:hypothetical protein